MIDGKSQLYDVAASTHYMPGSNMLLKVDSN